VDCESVSKGVEKALASACVPERGVYLVNTINKLYAPRASLNLKSYRSVRITWYPRTAWIPRGGAHHTTDAC
jgi:hypothetical protein